ncbi:hypothetical protein LSAT2_022688 [Lamellibrachia satsuma]|nr:hypothetical protein LSAT2_022688 [Lamellibrachia satsuma]
MGAVHLDLEREQLLPNLWTFSWLTAGLLLVGVSGNVYLVWVTTRRRFTVRWETFRLILRYSSVVDLSMCAVLASVVTWLYVVTYTGNDVKLTLKCPLYDRQGLLWSGAILVGNGVVVAARQAVTLLAFDSEVALLNRNRMRTARLLRDVAVVGVIYFGALGLSTRFAHVVDRSLCYVVGAMSFRAVHLFLVPIVVTVIIGIVVVTRPVAERQPPGDLLSDEATLTEPSSKAPEDDSALEEVSHSRWNRLVIVAHVALVTWFTTMAAMAAAGVLIEPVSADTLFVLTSCTSLTSAWSVFAVITYWT